MQEKETYQKIFKELSITAFTISVLLAVVIWFVAPFIISWINKPIYSAYINDLMFLIAAGFIYAIGYIPHYALYAMKGDKWIVAAHISAIVMFFLSLALVPLQNSIQAVALALLLAFGWMLFIKTIGYVYTKQHSIHLKA